MYAAGANSSASALPMNNRFLEDSAELAARLTSAEGAVTSRAIAYGKSRSPRACLATISAIVSSARCERAPHEG